MMPPCDNDETDSNLGGQLPTQTYLLTNKRVSTPHRHLPSNASVYPQGTFTPKRTFSPTLLPRVPEIRRVLNTLRALTCPPTRVDLPPYTCVYPLPSPHIYPAASILVPKHPRLPSQPCLPPHLRPNLPTCVFTPNVHWKKGFHNKSLICKHLH